MSYHKDDLYAVQSTVPCVRFVELPAELQAFFEKYHSFDHEPGTVSDEVEEQYTVESEAVEEAAHTWSLTPSEADGQVTILMRDDHRSVDVYGVFDSRVAAFKALVAEAFDVYQTGLDKLVESLCCYKVVTMPKNMIPERVPSLLKVKRVALAQ